MGLPRSSPPVPAPRGMAGGAELRLLPGGLSRDLAASPGRQTPGSTPPTPGCPPWGREAPVLAQPWHSKGSAGVQPSSESWGRSQPVSGINISCAQAVHLTLFRSSAPGPPCTEQRGQLGAAIRRPGTVSPPVGSITRPAGARSLALPAGCGQLRGGDGDGVSPGCRCFGVTLLSPLWFGAEGADGEGSLRRALAFVPPRDLLLIILDEPH